MAARLGSRLRGPLVGGAACAAFAWQQRQAESLGSTKKGKEEVTLGNYSIGKTLGEGAFAVVKLCTSLATGEKYALKLVDKAKTNAEMLGREVSLLRAAGIHRYIVSLVDSLETPKAWGLVLELVTGGEVFDRICDYGVYSERDAARVIRDAAEALQHLHQRGIVHRDLKPENLLLVTPEPGSAISHDLP